MVKAAVLVGPRKLELREVSPPASVGAGGLLRVEACGLCGTDYEQYEGALQAWAAPFPVVPGHEVVGRIEALGPDMARDGELKVGMRVAVEPVVPCGVCVHCLRGAATRCAARLGYGLYRSLTDAPGLWGGYAEYMYLHPNSLLHPLPEDLAPVECALVNPLANAVRWAHQEPRAGVGTSVLIQGAGQRGLCGVVAAKEAGCHPIILAGITADRPRFALARRLGADHVIDAQSDDLVQAVREISRGAGVDVFVDMSPKTTRPLETAADILRPGGTFILAGLKGFETETRLRTDYLAFREITVKGVLSAGWEPTESAIRILASRKYPLAEICTHEFPLAEADRAVRTLGREFAGQDPIRVTLRMDSRG